MSFSTKIYYLVVDLIGNEHAINLKDNFHERECSYRKIGKVEKGNYRISANKKVLHAILNAIVLKNYFLVKDF